MRNNVAINLERLADFLASGGDLIRAEVTVWHDGVMNEDEAVSFENDTVVLHWRGAGTELSESDIEMIQDIWGQHVEPWIGYNEADIYRHGAEYGFTEDQMNSVMEG